MAINLFLSPYQTFEKYLRWSLIGLLSTSFYAYAQSAQETEINFPLSQEPQRETRQFSIHGQSTYILQQKNDFHSAYFGQNSLLSRTEGSGTKSYTLSATLFLGFRLWDGAEFYYNPEMFEGSPFGNELKGLGGFQNSELQKGSYAPPVYYNARAFFRQTIPLEGERNYLESGPNQIAGYLNKNRVVLNYGKFATLDFFDQNTYSHDPRTQFQNFSLFSMASYGYGADSKGYTFGLVGEWYQDDWTVRLARLALPMEPNTEQLDYTLTRNYINQIELTHEHVLWEKPGAVRFLVYQQHAYMATFSDANTFGALNNIPPDIFSVRKIDQESWGYGINVEQSITNDIGVFGRWSWNPGNAETQTIEVSSSLSGGLSIKGTRWARPKDTLGIGFAINTISSAEINYLQQGGYTMFIGDGAINYKPERIAEIYYSAKLFNNLFITADYQRIENPAYNSARGPIHFLGLRAHIEI